MGTPVGSARAPSTVTRALRGLAAPVGAGVVLAVLTGVVALLLDDAVAFAGLAVLLGLIAGAYLGFAAADGRIRAFATESVGIAVTVALALLALALEAPALLAAGYVGHGLWDLLHHPRALDTVVPSWYPPFCLAYDVVVAVYVFARFA